MHAPVDTTPSDDAGCSWRNRLLSVPTLCDPPGIRVLLEGLGRIAGCCAWRRARWTCRNQTNVKVTMVPQVAGIHYAAAVRSAHASNGPGRRRETFWLHPRHCEDDRSARPVRCWFSSGRPVGPRRTGLPAIRQARAAPSQSPAIADTRDRDAGRDRAVQREVLLGLAVQVGVRRRWSNASRGQQGYGRGGQCATHRGHH